MKKLVNSRRSSTALRGPILLSLAFIILMPAFTLWNDAFRDRPGYTLDAPRMLEGVVTVTDFPRFDAHRFFSGSFQKDFSRWISENIAWRKLFYLVNNEINYSLFDKTSNPHIFVGANGELHGLSYIHEYCSRSLTNFALTARAWVAKLREAQDRLNAEGKAFIYVMTPSKAAVHPEHFLDRFNCTSPRSERNGFLPLYRDLLDKAGVRYVDGATSVLQNRDRYDFNLFTRGGVHWHKLAAAPTALAIVEETNRHFGGPVIPLFNWTYTVTNNPQGSDSDLAMLMNLIIPRVAYVAPNVTVSVEKPAPQAARAIRFATIGGSFSKQIFESLLKIESINMTLYSYFNLDKYSYSNDFVLKPNPKNEDFDDLRQAQVILLEENEQVIARSYHGHAFYDFIMNAPKAADMISFN